MAFPQRWNGAAGTLSLNILILPVGDPTAPLGGGPQFAGTAIDLVVNVASGLDSLPTTGTVPSFTKPYVATPPPVAPALFTSLFNQLVAKGITVTSGKVTTAPKNRARILKALPDSFKLAAPFESARSGDIRDVDGFGCSLQGQAPGVNPVLPGPDKSIAWGQVLSYALRQPVLAQALGLIYPLTLNISPALLADGGFVWITLDTANPANPWVNDFTANSDTVKSYSARIPAVDNLNQRPVFAATLFPVVASVDPRLAQAQFEAEQYDDGFAQIVHSNQPATIDTATLDSTQIAPGAEAGVQLGWDDVQVTVWLNNQIDLLRDRVSGASTVAEAPLGVQGYRVDVRPAGATKWRSLCLVNGTLPFDTTTVGGGATTSISGNEFWIAPAPIRPSAANNADNPLPGWLPLYFSQWAGSSLVLPDPIVQLLAFAVSNVGTPLPPATLPNPNPDLTSVPTLRYGNAYEFRVRLVDLTGGGPISTDPPSHAGPAPITQVNFRRYVPPKSLEVESFPAIPPFPARPPAVRTIQTLSVRRPRINYPEAVFAGVPATTFNRPNLDTLIQDAWAAGRAIGLPDPDVDRFEVRVEAHVPAHDTGDTGSQPGDLDDLFRVVYSLEIPFPAGDDPAVTVTLNYTDGVDDIATMSAPAPGTVVLPIPTARDIRVRLFPKAADKPNYYGNDAARTGLPTDYIVRQEAAAEHAVFPNNPETELQAFYFQPGANIMQLLAQQLGLRQNGLALSGAAGERTVFGASGQIRHSVSADASSLTFSNATELLGQWIVALVFDLERDWTWDGFATPALSYSLGGANIGSIPFPAVVASDATSTPGVPPDRTHTRIVFFDAFNPSPVAPAFPREAHLQYTVNASFVAAPSQQFSLSIRLPITTPPVQTPRIVSTGIAESPYHHSADYSSSSLRNRYLWIEFDQPLADKDDDAYFGRVLAYGPDPLLAGSLLPQFDPSAMLPEAVEPPLPIDPEPFRRIFSGQSADDSGLAAMTQMAPAEPIGPGKSGTLFLLPLPAGVTADDLALFGFWTYEFRVGHARMWSTAQGRYGRPLRVSGLQHPAPHLICSVERAPVGVGATAPYALTVYNGNRLYNFENGDPQTSIWFMLYTQVLQSDGAAHRNILLTHARGRTVRGAQENPQHGPALGPRAAAVFPEKSVETLLARIGLPKNSPLSVLAVEVLPGPLNVPDRLNRDVGGGDAFLSGEDPLGKGLGQRRVLRTSPLTAVPAIC
ncbi:MAG TPA: hypothetical protein VFA04_21665 [Bryobacteraceae bacterium]|nr:hypothetical protein [Bryobacteraceae bacterium]